MEEFIGYLSRQIEAGRNDAFRLKEEGRRDDADFARVRTNIYEVCRTVTNVLMSRPGAGAEAVKTQFGRFRAEWNAALEKARKYEDARNTVIGETKLKALDDVIAHFPEAGK